MQGQQVRATSESKSDVLWIYARKTECFNVRLIEGKSGGLSGLTFVHKWTWCDMLTTHPGLATAVVLVPCSCAPYFA